MQKFELNEKEIATAREIIGYLNFASGEKNPRFAWLWNELFFMLDARKVTPLYSSAIELLQEQLASLSLSNEAFRHSERASSVLSLLSEKVLPAYLEFHHDLLYHQTKEFLFNPFFLARLCRIILRQPLPWEDEEGVVRAVIAEANDFLGYRPVPVLEGEEKHEPNPHEWVAPVPLYQEDAGVAFGRYHDLIEKTLEILRGTDPVLLRDAWFDPAKLTELAIDPKAFDFDHPVNRRPNYYFGTWDPHLIDGNGYFRRFIVHQVTLDGILQRVESGGIPWEVEKGGETIPESIPKDQLLFEAASVLAGTILMGSGITGDHVQTHDSTVSLNTLMPQIASYRDRFYELLIQKVPSEMEERLNAEARRMFQPFGGARQDLNKRLAKRRADQLQRLHLARLYARMGYFDAADAQARIISVASARILSRIECLLTEGYTLSDKGDCGKGIEILTKIEELLHRGIACGALPDPWSLLGFGAQYSLFQSAENTVHDHRIDDLINLLIDIFDLYSRLLKKAAAQGDDASGETLSRKMRALAQWWDQFGSLTVSSVDGFSGEAIWESATGVAEALAVWHRSGIAAGDVSFWRDHVQSFRSPKAFVLLGEALLDQKDPVASMALMMHWLSNSEEIPLSENDYTFHGIAFRWMEELWDDRKGSGGGGRGKKEKGKKEITPEEFRRRWNLTRTFLERLEANADFYGEVPTLDVDPELIVPRPRASRGVSIVPPNVNLTVHAGERNPENGEEESMSDIFRKLLLSQFPPEELGEIRHFLEDILPRKSFQLIELFDNEDWIQEEADKDEGFREFIHQELEPVDMPLFQEFLKKCLVRLLLRIDRTPDDDPERKEMVESADLLHRVYHSVRQKIGIPILERFLLQRMGRNPAVSATPDPRAEADPLYSRYLSDAVPYPLWEKLRKEVEDPENSDFSLPGFFSDDDEDEEGENNENGRNDENGGNDENGRNDENGGDRKNGGMTDDLPDGTSPEGDTPVNKTDVKNLDASDYIHERLQAKFEEVFSQELEDDDEADHSGWNEMEPEGEEDPEDESDFLNIEDDEDEEDDEMGIDPTFKAAYDNMVFRDSAEDGVDDEMMESFNPNAGSDDDRLAEETDRINDRLAFIFSLVKLWKYAAVKSPLLSPFTLSPEETDGAREMFLERIKKAKEYQKGLEELLVTAGNYRIPKPNGTSESLLEYDQQHGTKEILLDRIIRTSVEVNDTILLLQAICDVTDDSVPSRGNEDGGETKDKGDGASKAIPEDSRHAGWGGRGSGPVWYPDVSRVMGALVHSDFAAVKRLWPTMLARLERETLLYIPTSRGGDPEAIVHCRCLQQVILRLLEYAPRQGLLIETFSLLRTVQKMEQIRPNGPGAITEFDRIVETAARNIARLIADSSRRWRIRPYDPLFADNDQALVHYMEWARDALLGCWLSHSQHIRISAVEAIMNPNVWEGVKMFIQKYGSDIFTQQFLTFRNMRAILHQGVESFLRSLLKIYREGGDVEVGELLVSDLAENRFPMGSAVTYLEMILECVAEDYSEYIDYNSTTTHSDHGEKLYMLLDMFRVLTQYERVAWNLKPVYWVHHSLIRSGHLTAASLWEKSIGRKSVTAAEENLKNYRELSARYGIWLPSIYERLEERFVRPLEVDRMCGLVGEAIQSSQKEEPSEAFRKLSEMIEYFAQEQTGIGFEVPEWLSALQDEVLRIQDNAVKIGESESESETESEPIDDAFNPTLAVEPILLSRSDLEKQIDWVLKNISFREH